MASASRTRTSPTDDLKRLVDGALERWRRIYVQVNSAGHGPRVPLLDNADEDWHRGLDVYLMNVIRPTRLVVPVMRAQRGGAIVNVSTAWAFEAIPAGPAVGESLTGKFGQAERLIEFPEGEQPAVGGHPGTVKFQLEAAVEPEPKTGLWRFTRWVLHPRLPAR